jgi:hypothetical protein
VTDFDHLLDRGLGATVGVMYPEYHGPLVTAQNSGYDWFPLAANGSGTIHPILGNRPTTRDCRGEGGTYLKRTNLRNDPHHHLSTLQLAQADRILPPVCPSCLSSTRGLHLGPQSSIPESYPQLLHHKI